MISPPRLAWLQLRKEKVRATVALAGVAFAVLLMAMQLGFMDALFRSAVTAHRALFADIVLIHPHWQMMAHPLQFSRRRLYQARGYSGVAAVTGVYTALGRWKNPDTGRTRDIFAIGFDPAEDVLDVPGLHEQRALVRYPDVVLFDRFSRPEFGPIATRVDAGTEPATEVSHHQVTVRGLVQMGTSFGIDGTIVTSDLNFMRIFPYITPGMISIGLVRLEPGADAQAVRDMIAAGLPQDVAVLTKEQFIDREVRYWAEATPIGYVLSFGVTIGIIVGGIIVYQILFADIADHLREYATLKAMGYTNRYLASVVISESLILAVGGFLPGLGLARWLFRITESATRLPMQMTGARVGFILVLTIGMCCGSGLVAMRKLRAADPAEIF
jgi:putative ABC transport system permease protein